MIRPARPSLAEVPLADLSFARLHAEPVSVFPALGELFDPLAAAGLEPATPGL